MRSEWPTPLRADSDPANAREARLLRGIWAPAPLHAARREASFRQICRTLSGGHRRGIERLVTALVGATVAAGALWFLRADVGPGAAPKAASPAPPTPAARSGQWKLLDLGDVGQVELSAEAVAAPHGLFEFPGERVVRFEAGVARVQIEKQLPSRPVVVVTPHLRVIAIGTRFDVGIADGVTSVLVIEGRVRVESSGATGIELEAAKSIRSDDPRLKPPPPPRLPPRRAAPLHAPRRDEALLGPGDPCDSAPSFAARRRCLEQLARGESLLAQNALYALGLFARDQLGLRDEALAYWEEYGRRFPDGALAAEAALARLETLVLERRSAEAIQAAAAFEQRFADDERAESVAQLRAWMMEREGARPGTDRTGPSPGLGEPVVP